MDVRNDTTLCDGRLDECVELLVTADGELEVARRDTLELEILGGVSGELEHLGTEVLENGRAVHLTQQFYNILKWRKYCRQDTNSQISHAKFAENGVILNNWT